MTRNVFLGADLVAGDQRDRRSRRRSTAPGRSGTSCRRRSSPSAPCRSRARSRRPRPTWSGCRRSRCGASRRRRTAARSRSARSRRHAGDHGRDRLPRRCCRRSSATATGSSWSRRSSTPSCRSTPTPTTRPAPARWPRVGADFDARLTMRDVILVKRGSKVKVGKTRKGHFNDPLRAEDRRAIKLPGGPRLDVGRGARRQAQVPLRQHPPGGVRRPQDPRGAGQGADQGAAEDQDAGGPRRRPQLRHRPPQRAREAGRRPRVQGARPSSASRTTARARAAASTASSTPTPRSTTPSITS